LARGAAAPLRLGARARPRAPARRRRGRGRGAVDLARRGRARRAGGTCAPELARASDAQLRAEAPARRSPARAARKSRGAPGDRALRRRPLRTRRAPPRARRRRDEARGAVPVDDPAALLRGALAARDRESRRDPRAHGEDATCARTREAARAPRRAL